MASTTETGHAKNIANFNQLINFCQSYGADYNPIKDNLKIDQLQALLHQSQNKLSALNSAKTAFNFAINERRIAFADLKKISTQIINALSVSGADPLTVDDAKSVNKKLQGKTSKKTKPTVDSPVSTISTSQQSYDQQAAHFFQLLEILSQSNHYTPNEENLKLTALQNKYAGLMDKNRDLLVAYAAYSNAIIDKNKALYDPKIGLVQTSKEVKHYIKSIFGATSPQYKQIGKIEIITQRHH